MSRVHYGLERFLLLLISAGPSLVLFLLFPLLHHVHYAFSVIFPLISPSIPSESPFFNTPFLHFKRIVLLSVMLHHRHSCCKRKKERKGLLVWPFLLHGNMLELFRTLWPSVPHTQQPLVKMVNWHFFLFFSCPFNPEPSVSSWFKD